LRTIDELASDELRKGFLKLRRTVQERMSLKEPEELSKIAELVNTKAVSSSIDFFFGRSELSQVVDQTNPLSQLTHERRLSALGPGGLNRKRAGFEVRDVHISHYGRICPVETPEGNNIGLISSLSLYATVDEYGFLTTPYRRVQRGRAGDDIQWLRADEEMEAVLAPPDVLEVGQAGRASSKLPEGTVLARRKGDVSQVPAEEVQYLDVSPRQTVGVSAALIPFLEHDDANRALMGSNMQRQAVPLIRTEPAIVVTGLEKLVAANSGMVVRARKAGTVTYVDAKRIVLDNIDEYVLRKFARLNERTCLNQRPTVRVGQRVKRAEIIADGPGCSQGELALGRNVLVAFMPFDGYNFEDAILISERLVKNDSFTSIHIEEYEVEIRETKLGREEFTRDIPNVSEKALRNLDENGVVRIGTCVKAADILVGKVAPKSKSELTPEEKLLHAIFGRAGEEVKNDSLELPAGEEGVVIAAKRFSRRVQMSDEQKRALKKEMKAYESQMNDKGVTVFRKMCEEINGVLDSPMVDPATRQKVGQSDIAEVLLEQIQTFTPRWIKGKAADRERAEAIHARYWPMIEEIRREKQRKLSHMKRGDELPSGVLEMVKVYVATKRRLSVGDKMAGRHGNKGVIARILPVEDMPYLKDGMPVDICLNPLGVPSRMNVGQILETHLGWAAAVLGFRAVTPVFDGASEQEIFRQIEQANEHVRSRRQDVEVIKNAGDTRELLVEMPSDGKMVIYDGRTGEPLDQKVTVGFMYLTKLHHLVDDKIHARSTGPYSLITQQPLGGKARTGGQRFGEMEVWALEAYGASFTLQEMLTVKSDDVEGRTKIYESMVKGNNTLEAGTPVSFDVLCNELRGLGLNVQLEKKSLI
jgi:DNA-directed RNA polymerase subunit beta